MAEELIVVQGNNTLTGEVTVEGSKNSALKHILCAVLGRGVQTVHNVPDIADIEVMGELLEHLGATVTRDGHTVTVDASTVDKWETPYELVSKMRASIITLGTLIGRFGCARVAMPGGCQIGARKIDMHIAGLEAQGVQFKMDHGFLEASTPHGLHGAHIMFDFPSVGATENLLMSSVVAKGTTVIENVAREPEIVDLATTLNQMGGRIEGAGTSTLEIEGVSLDDMHPCEHITIGDRVEAGTFLAGGALTGGPLKVKGVDPSFLRMAIMKFEDIGCTVETGDDWISISRDRALIPTEIQTLPHPGFPTDLQAQFMLLASLADGLSVITENIFENRFMFAAELARMGADIVVEDHHAFVHGVDKLEGADVSATDLRAGAAIVLAGIGAEGETRVHNIYHIDRGYENFVDKLSALGADIKRITVENS